MSMGLRDSQGSARASNDAISYLRRKGVNFWLKDGQLHYRAPKGALTREDVESIKASSRDIAEWLSSSEQTVAGTPRLARRAVFDHAPLSFSQLAHWEFFKLAERPAIRQIVSATRLRGALDVDVLQTCLCEMTRRHEALRTRIFMHDGAPVQKIDSCVDVDRELHDLSHFSEECRESEICRQVDDLILAPIDVAVGPLFGTRLLRLDAEEHVLILVMEHTISDAVSANILLRELLTAYSQLANGQPLQLPELSIQFADYAAWQRETYQTWLEARNRRDGPYAQRYRRMRFPTDEVLHSTEQWGWGHVPVTIDSGLKAELSAACPRLRTTLPMSVFTAYVATILRWCDTNEASIRYVSDGRVHPQTQNAIGYFASELYLQMSISANDTLRDLLSRCMKEYCSAYEQCDFSYALANARPECTRNPSFNWVPKVSEPPSAGARETLRIVPSAIHFTHPMLRNRHPLLSNVRHDKEPALLLYDREDDIVGDLYFPSHRFSTETMQRFAASFSQCLRQLARNSNASVSSLAIMTA